MSKAQIEAIHAESIYFNFQETVTVKSKTKVLLNEIELFFLDLSCAIVFNGLSMTFLTLIFKQISKIVVFLFAILFQKPYCCFYWKSHFVLV